MFHNNNDTNNNNNNDNNNNNNNNVLFLTFYRFFARLPYLKFFFVLLSYFCYINLDSRGLKYSCNKHSF